MEGIGNSVESSTDSTFRFVLLHHTFEIGEATERTAESHFDLLLESPCRAHLLTWELRENAFLALPPVRFGAKQLPNHRLVYLEYEGPVSGDRGSVKRVAQGRFRWLENSDRRVIANLIEPAERLTLEQQVDELWRAVREAR